MVFAHIVRLSKHNCMLCHERTTAKQYVRQITHPFKSNAAISTLSSLFIPIEACIIGSLIESSSKSRKLQRGLYSLITEHLRHRKETHIGIFERLYKSCWSGGGQVFL